MFIAQNNLQLIIEVAIIIHIGILLLFNVIALPLSMVMFLGMVLTVLIAIVFGVDAMFLLLPFISHHEFTHPFGALAVFGWVTVAASANLLSEVGIRSTSIKTLSIILFFVIAVAGGIMHRSFLILWFLGWALGYIIMSKSFKRSTKITPKSIIGFIGAGLGAFAALEILSRILDKAVLSPLLRVARLENNALPSLKLVLNNTTFWGHVQGSCYWKANCLGGADGYLTLPMSIIHAFGLPYHQFFGLLVVKKDYLDYMLPGIYVVAFDAGYFGLLFLMAWIMLVTFTGFTILRKYRAKRKEGSRTYLGREALLIGALSAFLAQSIVGLFIFNRSFNESALLAYIILSALVMAHAVSLKRSI
ncbi:hypothetical protein [Methanobacterium alcaliphilum]|uniref:hypothetical protein n=1 Tax=Methanobacterium alcaliphilum TaxID=392018 RepID=UPI00200A04C0|nr:hypothetical protein [Methanobacterium alcaliphilum]MCK9150451.1 hypothetical protein [Methanobacterium alcaliphilum]